MATALVLVHSFMLFNVYITYSLLFLKKTDENKFCRVTWLVYNVQYVWFQFNLWIMWRENAVWLPLIRLRCWMDSYYFRNCYSAYACQTLSHAITFDWRSRIENFPTNYKPVYFNCLNLFERFYKNHHFVGKCFGIYSSIGIRYGRNIKSDKNSLR